MSSFASLKAGGGHVFYEIGFYEINETSIVTELMSKLRPFQGEVCAELLSSELARSVYPRTAKAHFRSLENVITGRSANLKAGPPWINPIKRKRPPGRIAGRRNRTAFSCYCLRAGTPNPRSRLYKIAHRFKVNCSHLTFCGSWSVFICPHASKMSTFKSLYAAPRAERDSTVNCGLRCRRCSE
jgi:hypothetical protein